MSNTDVVDVAPEQVEVQAPDNSDDFSFIDTVMDKVEGNSEESPETPDVEPTEEVSDLDSLEPTSEEPAEEKAEEPAEETTKSPLDEFPDAEELGDVLDEPAKAKWGELRSELQQAVEAKAALEAQLEQNQQPLSEQYQAMEQELQAAKRDLAAYDIERSEEYQQAVGEPLDVIMEAAERIAENTEGVDANDLHMVLAMDGNPEQAAKLEDATQYMSEHDKFTFYRMVQDSSVLLAKDRQLRDQAAEVAVELENSKASAEQARQQQNMQEVQKQILPVFDKLEKILPESEHVDLATLKEKALAEDLYGLDAPSQAYAIASAAMTVPLIKELQSSRSEVTKLRAEMAALVNADPSAAPTGHIDPVPASQAGGSFFDAIDEHLKKQGQ